MMKRSNILRQSAVALSFSLLVAGSSAPLVSALAPAVSGGGGGGDGNTTCQNSNAMPSTVAQFIACGNQKISQRLSALKALDAKVNVLQKVKSSDKSALDTEITTDESNMQSLQTKLDADATLSAAKADYISIFGGFRVYVLEIPKVHIIKVADDQQMREAKLLAKLAELQQDVSQSSLSDADKTTANNLLSQANNDVQQSEGQSSNVETKVLALTPHDYNSDHTVLSGYENTLKTAASENGAAYANLVKVNNMLKANK